MKRKNNLLQFTILLAANYPSLFCVFWFLFSSHEALGVMILYVLALIPISIFNTALYFAINKLFTKHIKPIPFWLCLIVLIFINLIPIGYYLLSAILFDHGIYIPMPQDTPI